MAQQHAKSTNALLLEVVVKSTGTPTRAGPLPTILAPHGGPHAAVTLGW